MNCPIIGPGPKEVPVKWGIAPEAQHAKTAAVNDTARRRGQPPPPGPPPPTRRWKAYLVSTGPGWVSGFPDKA